MSGSGAFAWSGAGCELIGREQVAAQLVDLIRAHAVVAVVGPLGIGKTELVRWVVQREAAAGRVPPPAYASLAGVDGARGLLERTARALGRRHPPVESSRLVPALCALFTSAVCTLVWDDAEDAALDALADGLQAVVPPDGAETRLRIVIVARDPLCSGDGTLHAWAERNEVASLEVPPLDAAACRQLIATLEHRRGRSLQEEAILASGGNPLALQLAVTVGPAAASDPMVGLRRAIDALPSSARALLFVLLAAETSLRDVDLRAVCGSSTSSALLLLARHALVARDGDRAWLAPPMIGPVQSLVGPPQPVTWEVLEALARRTLAGAPDDPEALLLACRALAQRGRAPEALALLRGHVAARAAASPAALERTLGEIARGDTAAAADSLLALAREQLRWGDFEAARRTLDGLAALELSPPLAYRRCILRAEALVRAGEPAGATQELERARLVTPPGAEIALEERLADLAALRGDLYGARRALLRLARSTRSIPSLEGRRAVSLGFSYLLEERHDRALAWARKARQAYLRRGEAAVDIVVPIVEIASLMGLDQIDRATEVAARETAARTSRDDRGLGQGIVHPRFSFVGLQNDLGLVELVDSAPVTPLPLIRRPLDQAWVGSIVRLAGFGSTSSMDREAPLKRTGTAKVTALAQQKFTFQGAPSQTCLADSGAPALHEEDGVEYVVGVSSSGDAHCQEHAQAVRVDAFADDFILPAIAESAGSYGCQQTPDRAQGLSFLVLTLVFLRAVARRKCGPARR